MTGSSMETASVPVPETLIFPCSSSQRRCWFIDLLRPGSTILNIALRWELEGQFSPAMVERAFQALVDRHEILRTRFYELNGEPVQEVVPHLRFKLSQVDLTIVPEAARAEEALALAKREAMVPFRLDRLPLLRVTLIRVGAENAVLLVTVHQIAFDGFSIGLLAREFGLVAAALQDGTTPSLPELPMQYGDYARWQKATFSSRGFEAEAAYWRRQLADAPYFEVGADFTRPESPTSNGEIIAQMLPHDFGDALDLAAKAEHVTLFSLCYAAVAAALQRFTGETDIIIGTQLASRHHPDLEVLIGVFLNNLVLRVDASGDPSLHDFLGRANRTVQDALIHQQMPFDHLVELLNPPRDPSRTPLISINFAVLHAVIQEDTYGSFDLRAKPSLSPGSLYELNFFLVRWPSGWRLAIEYNTDLFAPATADALLAAWRAVLDQILENAEAPLSELPIAPRLPAPPAIAEDLAAVEAALLRNALVAEAVAIPANNPAEAGAAPYAFVVPSDQVRQPLETLPATLMSHLARQAELLAQPAGVSVLLALPRTASGAVDRRALPPVPRVAPPPPVADAASAELEAMIQSIWEEILGVSPVRPDSNFFDLGGHSLLAVRICVQVGRRLGRPVEVISLFRSPTMKAFAQYVASLGRGADDEQIVVVQPNGDETPVIAINHLLSYRDLAQSIGQDRPFYSIQTMDANITPVEDGRSLQEIASDYVRLIRKIRPRGPYILFGLCVHGVIGYEISQQLQADGDEVELLALVNGWHPTYFERLPFRRQAAIRLAHVRDSFKLVLKGKKKFLHFLAHYNLAHRSGLLKALFLLRITDEIPPRTGSKAVDDWLLYLMRARDLYRPLPYSGCVLQLLGDDAPHGPGYDDTLGWDGVITGPMIVQLISSPAVEVPDRWPLQDLVRRLHAGLASVANTERALT